VSTVPGIPQTFSTSVISFTDMKFKSHWPSVSPSAGVLVRFPLHVILSVEAACASPVAPKTSVKIQMYVKRVDICDHSPKDRLDLRNFSGTGVVTAMPFGQKIKTVEKTVNCAALA
jgi:hypothetical protein